MYLDISIIIVFLLSAYRGYKLGLIAALLNTFKWILAGILAFLLVSPVKAFLLKNTNIYNNLIPKENVSTFTPESLTRLIAEPISQIIFSIMVFFVLFIICKIILNFLSKLIHPKSHGPLSLINRILGFLFGSIKGLIVICILVSVMLPLSDTFFHNVSPVLRSNLESSYIAKYIYNSKPLWVLLSPILS